MGIKKFSDLNEAQQALVVFEGVNLLGVVMAEGRYTEQEFSDMTALAEGIYREEFAGKAKPTALAVFVFHMLLQLGSNAIAIKTKTAEKAPPPSNTIM